MPEIPNEYLGDGVYARFDGTAIVLYTERMSNGFQITHEIALEPRELEALNAYARRVFGKAPA